MSRHELNVLLNELGGAVSSFYTAMSAAATLIAPSANNKLQVFRMEVSGSTAAVASFKVGADAKWQAFLGASSHRSIDFAGRYLEVPSGSHLEITRDIDQNQIAITVIYREVPIDRV